MGVGGRAETRMLVMGFVVIAGVEGRDEGMYDVGILMFESWIDRD